MSPAGLTVMLSTLSLSACDGGLHENLLGRRDAGYETPDAYPVDAGRDTARDVAEVSLPDETVGNPCAVDADCDVTGHGVAHCSSTRFAVPPWNPTAVCMATDIGGGDVCDPGDGTGIALCDGDRGLCARIGGAAATCEPMCVVDETGKLLTVCAGRNACHPYVIGADSGGRNILFGYCQGGCATDADCPSLSSCDAAMNVCIAQTCSTDAECTKLVEPKTTPGFRCVDPSGKGHCGWTFAKKDGDLCTPDAALDTPSKDCPCLGKVGAAVDTGLCASWCRTVAFGVSNPECASGFVCDPQLPLGSFASTFQLPAGVAGRCIRACTADADCGAAGWTCAQSAGSPSKTCHPPA